MKVLLVLLSLGLFSAVGIAKLIVCVSRDGQPTTSTKRISVLYPKQPWPQYHYRSCVADRNLTTLNCSQPNSGLVELFTMDVRFSGRNTKQNWTCQRDKKSLVCKN